ncbi:uncharacterized protein LOC119687114 isoform X2 [Teleopsis dalmanni]|uniref:uncharacterized protein LOC119687114 isoform X2 n=1 Tax=Teleopsis dalmanni TaxID=139649 RepID=UPI0018CE2BCC|nr:uncharacterized protein LOC119687114 isoform X2 [Teleopsis dalmanni]
MDPQKITELANLLRNNGDKILNSEFKLTLSGSLLRALNDSFTLIADTVDVGDSHTFQVAKPINSKSPVFRDLQLIHDFVQKTGLLCIIHYPTEEYFEGTIDISKFHMLKRLEVQKTNVLQIIGIQPLRSQLEELICIKSLNCIDEIITNCGGDNSNGFVWNELRMADFSYNNLQKVDTSLEFAQYLQHLNLRHNNLQSVDAIKWLPNLKILDLSFNRLIGVPQLHAEAYKRLQVLNMSNNLVEDLLGIAKLSALTDLDLSDNCLLEHTYLLPLSTLITLKILNLYGNPLHCHPKHRLATAQFLHKNCANMKFILDFEPLSKRENSITGTHQMRHGSTLNRYSTKSASPAISSRATPSSHTPASSFGSVRSFSLLNSNTDTESSINVDQNTKKRTIKIRTVNFDEESTVDNIKNVQSENSSISEEPNNTSTAYLEAKEQINILREKYGAEWLQAGNAEMINSVLGIETDDDLEAQDSQNMFKEFLGELSETSDIGTTDKTSTPINSSLQAINIASNLNNDLESSKDNDTTLYMSAETTVENLGNITTETSPFHKSLHESNAQITTHIVEESLNADDTCLEESYKDRYLKNVYTACGDSEPEVSEPEDDEETYIVYGSNQSKAIFLTISSNFLREKDTLSQRTRTKWSLKILESCERVKSNTLRIHFDTVKVDKQSRIYTVEDDLCKELEKKLRNILSQRDLTEMNQTLYHCVNCSCQFSHENRNLSTNNQDVRCPDCKSKFVAELHELPKSYEKKNQDDNNISPASTAGESPVMTAPKPFEKSLLQHTEETNSIGSANSLNESSSCSKITNSQSSFDTNQSVVGSSNTDRENDFKSNCESDVDIISNPSQSSIEVLDQANNASRKSSEERRLLQIPILETIDDSHKENESIQNVDAGNKNIECNDEKSQPSTKLKSKSPVTGHLGHFNLTESSSSGSVTDSVCTAYEQQQQLVDKTIATDLSTQNSPKKTSIQNFLSEESGQHAPTNISKYNNNNNNEKVNETNGTSKKEESGISSMFGALFQSTNILMSSSKKLIDIEATSNIQSGAVETPPSPTRPFKFNYTDFNDVDHRLKLYFYQTKFEASGEHFKWLARGRIYNENTHTLFDGLVVMTTIKCYVMEAFAAENDDVSKWLRQVLSATVDRLESIQLLPWKIGLSFRIRDFGGFLLLLQDIQRIDSLLLCFQNNALPTQCELKYPTADEITNRLNVAVRGEKLKMCSILNSCEVTMDKAKRSFNTCTLLTTDTTLYITSENFGWLSLQTNSGDFDDFDVKICISQFMSNLVDIEYHGENVFSINFLDETQNKCELWTCKFETKENAEFCMAAIGQSWELLFGVPLFCG